MADNELSPIQRRRLLSCGVDGTAAFPKFSHDALREMADDGFALRVEYNARGLPVFLILNDVALAARIPTPPRIEEGECG